ncbi:hypothetical protein N2W54_006252 [Lotmaria passim]
MNVLSSAFPVLTRRASQSAAAGPAALTTRLCAVTQAGLPLLRAQLCDVALAPIPLDADGMHCTLSVGSDVSVPLTIIGACEARGDDEYVGDDNIVVHSPGLPGGFVVTRQELLRTRARLSPYANDDAPLPAQPSLGSMSLMEAVTAHFTRAASPRVVERATARGILDDFYTRARRRHFSLAGMAELIHRGSQLDPGALQLDFPYQCGGAQATKRYLDITHEVTDVFGASMRHGTKVLSRYGVAVSVGVVDRMAAVAAPALLWHPYGAPAACLAPLLHSCALLPVGTVALDYNGPVPGSPLMVKEDPQRYMKLASDGFYDDSAWLTEGLFGVKPGSVWPPTRSKDAQGRGGSPSSSCKVVGVGYNDVAAEMELYVRDSSTGEVVAAADV